MVRAKDLTPEEAKRYLMDQQKRTRERQREFAQRRKEEGYKRINAFISPEAFKTIDSERLESGQNTGDVISRIIMDYQASKSKPTPVKKKKKPVSTNKKKAEYNRDAVAARAKELKASGFKVAGIAEQLTQEGFVNSRGIVQWSRHSVNRLTSKK